MIIEIALGIVLGFLIIIALPYIFKIGIWAIIITAIAGILALVWFYFSEIILALRMIATSSAYLVVIIFLAGASITIPLVLLGYISYYSKFLNKWLHLGKRPALVSNDSRLIQYKTIFVTYLCTGSLLAVPLIIIGIILLFLTVKV